MSVIQRIGQHDVIFIDELPTPTQDDVIEFVRLLRGSLMSCGFYPAGHKMIFQKTEDFHKLLQKLLADTGVVVMSCTHTVEVNGVRILRAGLEQEKAEQTADMFGLKGIENIVFLPESTVESLATIFHRWYKDEGDSTAADWFKGLGHPGMNLNMLLVKRTGTTLNSDSLITPQGMSLSESEQEEIMKQAAQEGLRLRAQQPTSNQKLSPPRGLERLRQGQTKSVNTYRSSSGVFRAPVVRDSFENTPGLGTPLHGSTQSLTGLRASSMSHPSMPAMRAPTPSGHQRAASSQGDTIVINPQQLDQSDLDLKQFDFQRIDPQSLFASQRFQDFLRNDGSDAYLSNYLPGLSQEGGGGSGSFSPSGGRGQGTVPDGAHLPQRTQAIDSLIGAIEQLPDATLQQGLLQKTADMLTELPSFDIAQHIVQLGDKPSENQLREEIFARLSGEQVQRVEKVFLNKIRDGAKGAELDKVIQSLKKTTTKKLQQKGGIRDVLSMVGKLGQIKDMSQLDGQQKRQLQPLLETLSSPEVTQSLLRMAVLGNAKQQTVGVLGLQALGLGTSRLFANALNRFKEPTKRAHLLKIMRTVLNKLEFTEKEEFFFYLWQDIDDSDLGLEEQLVTLTRQEAPDYLEKRWLALFSEYERDEQQLMRHCQQVLNFHTPALRKQLLRILKQRRMAKAPELEERILRVLTESGTIEGAAFLSQYIFLDTYPEELKGSAIWLLGRLKSIEALKVLEEILSARVGFLRQPAFPSELRVRALDALLGFPWGMVEELVAQASRDSDAEVRTHALLMLPD